MGQIQVLSFEVANLIAAGEVVDRPASAIKEMMENAIDAGAKHITVEIQHGGVTFMRVTDDGCGMSEEDLPMAIRRHATSKIKDATDLESIFTLGFRGEALAAISSVSDMRIISKRREDPMGHMLEVRGGQFLGVTEHGSRDGTTVIVENLFGNVPARRKFLKRDATESMAVSANVERVALSHPEIAVRFIVDGVQKLETAGDGKLQSAIYAVFGRDFASRLIPVTGDYEGITISGFIGRPDHVKVNRNYQNFFINHRYVRSKTAMAAIEQAFVSYCAPEKYPCCVIFIELNPARVDVNVHPAKLEVKFSNEKPVFEAIYYSVRQALEQNTVRPDFSVSSPTAKLGVIGDRVSEANTPIETGRPESLAKRQLSMNSEIHKSQKEATYKNAAPAYGSTNVNKPPQERMTADEYLRRYTSGKQEKNKDIHLQTSLEATSDAAPISDAPTAPVIDEIPMEVYEAEARAMMGHTAPIFHETEKSSSDVEDMFAFPEETTTLVSADIPEPITFAEAEKEEEHTTISESPVVEPSTQPWRMVGEVFNSYVIVEQGDRMLIIDKHAAHERIIFEDLKAQMKAGEANVQMLMLPIDVMLMSDEVGLLDTYRHELEAIGFSFTCMRNTVSVDAIPTGIDPSAVPDMFATFAEQLRDGSGVAKLTRDIAFEKALYQASCKAAIKAGRVYPPEHIQWLVGKLMELPDITYCPHGRPVAMEMKKRNIDHQFERC
ncbi:MAG: DNA mismatch repair endonuclease MutL [Ruminococcaceae bacterium]|nr:DNA mismatch repair endonuclease MutL [Oscillospiraceae bacterium]